MGDEVTTPVVIERPVLNPANRAVVMVIHNLTLQLEAFPRQLADIARVIQLSAEPLGETQREGIAGILGRYAAAVLSGTQQIREAG